MRSFDGKFVAQFYMEINKQMTDSGTLTNVEIFYKIFKTNYKNFQLLPNPDFNPLNYNFITNINFIATLSLTPGDDFNFLQNLRASTITSDTFLIYETRNSHLLSHKTTLLIKFTIGVKSDTATALKQALNFLITNKQNTRVDLRHPRP
jgi:hypothetical protein